MYSDFLERNAREVIEIFWEGRLPEKAHENKQAILGLFSEQQVSTDLEGLKAFPLGSGGAKGKARKINTLSTDLPLQYAQQSLIQQSFRIIPQSDENTFIWDSKQMVQTFASVVKLISDIPGAGAQTSQLAFMLRASQWELTRAYYLTFYWFTTIGPQLVSALVDRVQTGHHSLEHSTPLEKLADHICRYIKAGSQRNGLS